MSGIPVYNVPNLPGIPPMVRAVFSNVATFQGVAAAVGNTISFFQGPSPLPPWGIYDDQFNSVVDADSILSFTHRNEASVADFPVQDGTFATYNKVVLPYSAMVRVSKGGTLLDRTNLLRQIEALFSSLKKYTIVTPERSYLNVNVEGTEVTRIDKDDAFFLTHVDLRFRQVKPVTAVFTTTAADTQNAQDPSAPAPANQGVQQPATTSSAASAQATNVLSGGAP